MNNTAPPAPLGSVFREFAREYLSRVRRLLSDLDIEGIVRFGEALEAARTGGRTVFIAGNGGSAATASHWANDLNLAARIPGGDPLRCISLTDNVALMTALANDRGYEQVFVGQLETLFAPGDVLVAISASGNSPNLIRAVDYANARGGITIGLTGFDGGALRRACTLSIHVATEPSAYGPVEDVHMLLDHVVTGALRLYAGRVAAAPR